MGVCTSCTEAQQLVQVLNMMLNVEQAHREALKAAREPSKLKGYFKWQREKFSGQAFFNGRKLREQLTEAAM